MPDRLLVYPGQTPKAAHILSTNQNLMIGLGHVISAAIGANTVVDGLTLSPTSPTPNLTVTVGTGTIFQQADIDQNAYGVLGTNLAVISKEYGIDVSTPLTLTAPSSAGQSINYLIQAAPQETDGTPQLLTYFNSNNALQPFLGPGNDGVEQNTVRTQTVLINELAGTPANTGTQTTPPPTSGYIPLWIVTVAFGQTQITSTSISVHPSAPFISSKIGDVPAAVQSGKWTYWPDTGSSSAYVITPNPAITAYAAGQRFSIKLSNTSAASPTLNVNGLGTRTLNYNDGTGIKAGDLITGGIIDVVFDGTNFEVISFSRQSAMRPYYAATGGSANVVTATVDTLPNLYAGLEVTLSVTTTNTGGTTLNVNGTGAITVLRNDGASALSPGDLASGSFARVVYNGTNWLLMGIPSIGTRGFRNGASFTSGGTWTAPAGVTQVFVRMVGGGGGGGGGFADGYIAVTPGSSYTITIGAAGAAATAGGTGGNGGTSSFGSVLSATGGQGGGGASGSSAGNAGSGGGGAGSALLCSQTGGQGNSGCSTGAVWSGRGGSAGWGGGEGSGGNGTGGNAQAYGGGGGGTVNGASGTGAQGAVNVYW
jgi:hypothetical protein